MKVSELIQHLQTLDPHLEVFIGTDECENLNDADGTEEIKYVNLDQFGFKLKRKIRNNEEGFSAYLLW